MLKLNTFRTIIDESGRCVRYMIVPIYTDGGVHINVMGAENLTQAKDVALKLSLEHNLVCHSINEGNYK